ncbi:hypothetical protein NW765_001067 [Fusarium oxysporum]|nr:hypothetical protein NW765_001067 [Fusarium oxysporum]
MTEPENFEDDLFADLYDDNDAAKPGSAPAAAAPLPQKFSLLLTFTTTTMMSITGCNNIKKQGMMNT